MSKETLTPDLRFEGFRGELYSDYLRNVASFTKGQGYTKKDLKSDGCPIILYGQLYTDYTFTIYDVKRYVDIKEGAVISKGNEVIIPASGETSEDIARASAILQSGVIIGGDMNVITPDEGINSAYLAMNLSSPNPSKQMANKAQGKSVVHLQNNEIKKVKINLPNLQEQEKVAGLISGIEKNIACKGDELVKLQNFKQAMLQKMFPKEGERVPEIRFEGFDGEWEKCLIGDLSSDTFGGGTPSTQQQKYWNGTIPWIQSSDLTEHQVFGVFPKKKISKTGVTKSAAKIVPKNSLAIVARVGVGKLAVMPFSYTTSQDFLSLSNLETDIWFSGYSIYRKIQSELNAVQGTSIKGITKDELLSKTVCIPQEDEQKQIGQYFHTLDKHIQAKQAELKKLKQFKQAMLNKLFV